MRQGTVAMQHVQAGAAPIGPAATHASNRILQAGRTIDSRYQNVDMIERVHILLDTSHTHLDIGFWVAL